jgi:predicted metal-dependent phosphoesterase TrpH
MGLAALAIADHDTLEGIQPALEEGRRLCLEVLPAIELGTEINGREIHVLGYLIDITNKHLLDELDYFRRTRKERVVRMIDKLHKLGFPVDSGRVAEIAGFGSVGRPHIARAMIETGMVDSMEEAFDLYIGEGKPGYEPRNKYIPAEAVRLIRHAGGVAVLAHPGLGDNHDLIAALIPSLIIEGLQGIEVYHPAHTAVVSEHYLGICEQHGLLATGGSDYHGVENKKHNRLGAFTVPYRVVERMKDLACLSRDYCKSKVGGRQTF